MKRRLIALAATLLACSSEAGAPAPAPSSSAGASGVAQGGATNSAGAPGTAGASAGTTSSAGAANSAGASTIAGSGGTADGGVGGAAGTNEVAGGGGSGGTSTTKPSPGCGKAGRPAGGVVTVAGDHIYQFPEKYDGKTPLPVVFALHAFGNPYTQLQGLTNGTPLATEFVRVFPKSAGSGWVVGTDTPRLTKMYDEVLSNYCIDTSRAFLTGHSSGAQMVVQMLCAGEKRFKAVAPVAASKYCASVATIPTLYIQGKKDAQRGNGNGADVVQVFTSSNQCGSMTLPDTSVMTCKSTFDQANVTPGCVRYQGCQAPTVWCSHDDNGYNASDGHMHGWPCFASNAMAAFFLSLP